MPSRVNTVRRKEFPYEIKTLSGNELHNFNTHADSEYLVIDLGNVKGRRSDFNKTIEVAMSAAMNAVLASMPELAPVAKKSKAASLPSEVKSVNEAVDGVDKQ
ncbi:integrase, partial [Yersinia enterocolitica]